MRIADVVADIDPLPRHVVDATASRRPLLDRVGLDAVGRSLDEPGDPWEVSEDEPVVVLVAAEAGDLLGPLLDAVLPQVVGRVAATTVVLLSANALEPDAVVARVTDLGAQAHRVVAIDEVGFITALVVTAARDPEVAQLRTMLALQRYEAASLRARVRGAEAEAAAVADLEHERARQRDRIGVLRDELDDLRERFDHERTVHERALSTRGRELVVARDEATDLRESTSYRMGHALVRLVKDPSTTLRWVPQWLLRWLRRTT